MAEDDTAELDLSRQLTAEFLRSWVQWIERLMRENRWPLSGDVAQWISAWGEAVGQIGLFNINTVGSANPQLERSIGRKYSPGRQMGRMLDVLVPLVMANEALLEEKIGKTALTEFQVMVRDIEKLKRSKCRTADDIVREVRSWHHNLTSQEFDQRRKALIEALNAIGI